MSQNIKHRQVFYLSGFDPRRSRHYHKLYKSQAKIQSSINGLSLNVSEHRKVDKHCYSWLVSASDQSGATAETIINFLCWSDIIHLYWSQKFLRVLGDFISFLYKYILTGVIIKFAKASPKQMIAAFYPVLFLLFSFAIITSTSYTIFRVISGIQPDNLWFNILGAILAITSILLLWKVTAKLGNKFGVFWLLRIYVFCRRWADNQILELESRIDIFADRIILSIEDKKIDEVQIVAHSVGTILAVPLVAELLRRLEAKKELLTNNRLALITLGECIPLVSFHPKAVNFRSDLQAVALNRDLLWIDYTAPTDGACFPLLNPVSASGLKVLPGTGPLILSPRFFTLYEPKRYKKLRRDWYSMHFLYLMASDYLGNYDYFNMTAGLSPITACLERIKNELPSFPETE